MNPLLCTQLFKIGDKLSDFTDDFRFSSSSTKNELLTLSYTLFQGRAFLLTCENGEVPALTIFRHLSNSVNVLVKFYVDSPFDWHEKIVEKILSYIQRPIKSSCGLAHSSIPRHEIFQVVKRQNSIFHGRRLNSWEWCKSFGLHLPTDTENTNIS